MIFYAGFYENQALRDKTESKNSYRICKMKINIKTFGKKQIRYFTNSGVLYIVGSDIGKLLEFKNYISEINTHCTNKISFGCLFSEVAPDDNNKIKDLDETGLDLSSIIIPVKLTNIIKQ